MSGVAATVPEVPRGSDFVSENRRFLIIWAGRSWSMAMSSVISFALSVHVYQQSQSAAWFALMLVASVVPGLLAGPVAGRIADAFPGRSILLLESGALMALHVLLGMILWFGTLEVWHLIVFNTAVSVCVAVYLPAWMLWSKLLVHGHDRPRALGLTQLSWSMAQTVGPMLGGLMLPAMGLRNMVVMSLLSLSVEVATLWFAGKRCTVSTPDPSPVTPSAGGSRFSELLRLLCRYPWSCGLLFYGCVERGVFGVVVAIIPPFVLSAHSVTVLGSLQSTCALGAVLGSLTLALRRGSGRGRRIRFGLGMLMGLTVCLFGVSTRLPCLYGWGVLAMFMVPLLQVPAQLFLESKVPARFQGRMVALRAMLGQAAFSLAALGSAVVAEQLFAPMMRGSGMHALVMPFLAMEKGAEYGLMLVLAGLLMMVVALIGLVMSRRASGLIFGDIK